MRVQEIPWDFATVGDLDVDADGLARERASEAISPAREGSAITLERGRKARRAHCGPAERDPRRPNIERGGDAKPRKSPPDKHVVALARRAARDAREIIRRRREREGGAPRFRLLHVEHPGGGQIARPAQAVEPFDRVIRGHSGTVYRFQAPALSPRQRLEISKLSPNYTATGALMAGQGS